MVKTAAAAPFDPKREALCLPFPSRRAVTLVMAGAMAFLSVCGLAVAVWIHYRGLTYYDTLVSFFNVDEENNLPSWYSGLSLAFCAALLFAIAAAARRERRSYMRHWFGLAWIFLLLSLDEIGSVHERVGKVAGRLVHFDGWLHFVWVLLAASLLIVVAATYLRFVLHLPVRIRRQFLISGAIYVTGALVMEVIDGHYVSQHSSDLTYYVMVSVEEFLEMLGVLLFARALMTYLAEFNGLTLRFQPENPLEPR